MAEVKSSKLGLIKSCIAFGAYVLFFLCMCIGVVKIGGEVFGISEAFDIFDDPKAYLIDGVLKLLMSIFTEKTAGDYGLYYSFVIYGIVTFVIITVKVIFATITFVKGASSGEWDATAEKLEKKYNGFFATIVAFIVFANLWVGSTSLAAGGIIFVIIALAWYAGKPVLESLMNGGKADVEFILNIVYCVLKAVAAILALKFILDRALISGILFELLEGLFNAILHDGDFVFVLRNVVSLYVAAVMTLIVLGRFQKAMSSSLAGDDAKAKSSTKFALILAVVAIVVDLLVCLIVVESDLGFSDWYKANGKYYLMNIIFLAIAFAVYYFPMVINMVKEKSAVAEPATEEIAATEEAPAAEVAEEAPATEEEKAE